MNFYNTKQFQSNHDYVCIIMITLKLYDLQVNCRTDLNLKLLNTTKIKNKKIFNSCVHEYWCYFLYLQQSSIHPNWLLYHSILTLLLFWLRVKSLIILPISVLIVALNRRKIHKCNHAMAKLLKGGRLHTIT